MSQYNPIDYSTLTQYNTTMIPTEQVRYLGKQSSGVYVIPQYSSPGYATLARTPQSGQVYYNITSAYGSTASECGTQFLSRNCV